MCYLPQPSASADNTNLCLNNSSYPTRPHSIIVYYTLCFKWQFCSLLLPCQDWQSGTNFELSKIMTEEWNLSKFKKWSQSECSLATNMQDTLFYKLWVKSPSRSVKKYEYKKYEYDKMFIVFKYVSACCENYFS